MDLLKKVNVNEIINEIKNTELEEFSGELPLTKTERRREESYYENKILLKKLKVQTVELDELKVASDGTVKRHMFTYTKSEKIPKLA